MELSMIFMRALTAFTFLLVSFSPLAQANESDSIDAIEVVENSLPEVPAEVDEATASTMKEVTNVIQEGRVYLALSSDERGYGLAFESHDYRASLKEIENTRALNLCHEAGFESLAAKPLTAKVKSPELIEAWSVEDGQLVQKSYANVRPYLFTNNGCKHYTPKRAALISSVGFAVGTVVSFATIPVMGPAAALAGVSCFGALFIINSNAYTIDGKNLLPIRASKAFQRIENDKVVQHIPLPLVPAKWVVKHKVFTEVLCK
jgi:hypothetical protein